jgi:hypothetical protein
MFQVACYNVSLKHIFFILKESRGRLMVILRAATRRPVIHHIPLIQLHRTSQWSKPRSIMVFNMFDLPFGVALTICIGLLGLLLFATLHCSRSSNQYPPPPGPPGQLFFGHVRTIPVENSEIYYQKMSKEYSEHLAEHSGQFRTEAYTLQIPTFSTLSNTERQSLC